MANFKKRFLDWFWGRLPEGCVSVGGQAVIEGVMMQGPKTIAVAVRKENGKIVYRKKPAPNPGAKYPILRIPLVRGVVSFFMSLINGMKILTDSAEMAGQEAEEPSKFEKKIAEIFHVKPDDVMMAFAIVLAVALSILLFFALPTGIETLLKRVIKNRLAINLLGGLTRMAVFLLYVFLVSRLKEIRRVFMYHGAEHKSIFCFESGEELTVENARKFTRFHPRCGTSFLVLVMLISILMFVLFGSDSSNLFVRLGSRLALLPLVAGVSYEVLKGLARAGDTPIVRALRWPGLMVQRITTAEPDDSMLEVALVSLKAALDMPNPLPPEQSAEDEGEQTAESEPADGTVQADEHKDLAE